MKLCKEGCFQLASSTMVVGIVRLEYLIQPFEKEAPKSVQWAEISYKLAGVSCVVMIGPNAVLAI